MNALFSRLRGRASGSLLLKRFNSPAGPAGASWAAGLCLLAGLSLSTPASAQVVLFQDCNYAGKSASLKAGNYVLADLVAAGMADKDVSSVKVPSGYQVTFYDADNYQGASLVKNADTGCLVDAKWNDRATSLKVESIPAPEPPLTWQEHWFEHAQEVKRVYFDADLAVYYDDDVSRSVTWPNTYLGDVWRYTKRVYGSFGSDSRMYAVFHTGRYSGGHPSTYFDESHDSRNMIDLGPGPWTSGAGNDLDLTTHEVAHIVEGASKGAKGSPAFGLWGDSKWAEIFNYDVYKGLNRPADATRWYNLMIRNSDKFPRWRTYWFRDWFYPIYTDHGGAATLNKYFELLAQYYPKPENVYRPMNWGEFVHFWSGAAGINLKPMATLAFGWNATREAQFTKARQDFAFTYPDTDKRVVAIDQDLLYGGYSVKLPVGRYNAAALTAAGVTTKDVSSMRVPAGYSVTLYDGDDFTGASLVKTADDSTLVDESWENRAVSLVVSGGGPLNTHKGLAGNLLSLFPNPSANVVTLAGLTSFPATISVFDAKGALVKQVHVPRPTPAPTFDLVGLRKGLYRITVTSSNGVQTLQFAKE